MILSRRQEFPREKPSIPLSVLNLDLTERFTWFDIGLKESFDVNTRLTGNYPFSSLVLTRKTKIFEIFNIIEEELRGGGTLQ